MKMKFRMLITLVSVAILIAILSIVNKVNATSITENYTLSGDSTEAIVVSSGNVTIDLGGHNLTVEGDAITVEAGATATITGNGTIIAKGESHGAIVNKGKITVENGTFCAENFQVKII